MRGLIRIGLEYARLQRKRPDSMTLRAVFPRTNRRYCLNTREMSQVTAHKVPYHAWLHTSSSQEKLEPSSLPTLRIKRSRDRRHVQQPAASLAHPLEKTAALSGYFIHVFDSALSSFFLASCAAQLWTNGKDIPPASRKESPTKRSPRILAKDDGQGCLCLALLVKL